MLYQADDLRSMPYTLSEQMNLYPIEKMYNQTVYTLSPIKNAKCIMLLLYRYSIRVGDPFTLSEKEYICTLYSIDLNTSMIPMPYRENV